MIQTLTCSRIAQPTNPFDYISATVLLLELVAAILDYGIVNWLPKKPLELRQGFLTFLGLGSVNPAYRVRQEY